MKKKWLIFETNDKEHCFLKKFGFSTKKTMAQTNLEKLYMSIEKNKQIIGI
jgi:hypothetical protein